jgi:hypothetical protein
MHPGTGLAETGRAEQRYQNISGSLNIDRRHSLALSIARNMVCIIKSVSSKAPLVLAFFAMVGGTACCVPSDKVIVRTANGKGALMATNSDGLRQLHDLYSLPKTCTEANVRAARVPEVMFLCTPVSKPIPNDIGLGLVRIPEGTRGTAIGRAFVLPEGRLVKPYAANTFDMARDGAIEVERIRITQPPNVGLEGWVYNWALGRLGSPPL